MKIDYRQYLQSPHWKTIRKKIIDKYKTCQLCNSGESLQVHHRTYERLGNELLEDLTLLCETCHKKFHDREVTGQEKIYDFKVELIENGIARNIAYTRESRDIEFLAFRNGLSNCYEIREEQEEKRKVLNSKRLFLIADLSRAGVMFDHAKLIKRSREYYFSELDKLMANGKHFSSNA